MDLSNEYFFPAQAAYYREQLAASMGKHPKRHRVRRRLGLKLPIPKRRPVLLS